MRPPGQAAVGRPGPDFGPAGPIFGCTGRIFGATGLLGRLWGQIGPIRGPVRGRPTLENHAPAKAGSRFVIFVPTRSVHPSDGLLDPILGAVLGPFLGLLGLSWALLGGLTARPDGPEEA